MKKSRLLGALCVLALSWTVPASSTVIDAYFGANYIGLLGYLGANPELELVDITYIGGSGANYTTAMPVAPGFVGLPDDDDSSTDGYVGL